VLEIFSKQTFKLHGIIGVNIMPITSNGEIFDSLHFHIKIDIFSFSPVDKSTWDEFRGAAGRKE
jgi:hypothetical protein